jgi:hypothetical protein
MNKASGGDSVNSGSTSREETFNMHSYKPRFSLKQPGSDSDNRVYMILGNDSNDRINWFSPTGVIVKNPSEVPPCKICRIRFARGLRFCQIDGPALKTLPFASLPPAKHSLIVV